MAKIPRFGNKDVQSKQPISQGGTGGGLLTQNDINRSGFDTIAKQAKSGADTRLKQINIVQQTMKDQDDALLAASTSSEYLGNLLQVEDEVLREGQRTGNYQDVVTSFQDQAGSLKEKFLDGIDDPETSFRVEAALQKYELSQTISIQQQQFGLRNKINEKRLRDSIMSAAKVAGSSKSTEAGILLAATTLENIDNGQFSPAVIKQIRQLASDQIVERAIASVIISDPEQALKDLEPGGILTPWLTVSKMNTLRQRAKAANTTIDFLGQAKFRQDFKNAESQLEENGFTKIVFDYSAFPEKKRAALKFETGAAMDVAKSSHDIKLLLETSTLGDLSKHIENLENKSKSFGLASDITLVKKAKQRAAKIIGAYAVDPVSAELTFNPFARELNNNLKNKIITQEKYSAEIINLLTAKGAPIRLLTNAQAEAAAEEFNRDKSEISIDNKKKATELAKKMTETSQKFGKYFPRVLDEMINEGKLDEGVGLAFSYTDRPELVARMILGGKIKKEELLGHKQSDIDDEIFDNDEIKEFFASVTRGNFGSRAAVSTMRKAIQSVTKSYLIEGDGDSNDIETAVKKAAKSVITDYYAPFRRGKSSINKGDKPSLYVPRFDADGNRLPNIEATVQRMDVLTRSPQWIADTFANGKLALLQNSPDKMHTANIIANNGILRDTGDGNTFYIQVPTADGGTAPILDEGGGLLTQRYSEVLDNEIPEGKIVQRESVSAKVRDFLSGGVIGDIKEEMDRKNKTSGDVIVDNLVEDVTKFMKKDPLVPTIDTTPPASTKKERPSDNPDIVSPDLRKLIKHRTNEFKKNVEDEVRQKLNDKVKKTLNENSKRIQEISKKIRETSKQFKLGLDKSSIDIPPLLKESAKKIDKLSSIEEKISSGESLNMRQAQFVKSKIPRWVHLDLQLYPGVSDSARGELIRFQLVRHSLTSMTESLASQLKRDLETLEEGGVVQILTKETKHKLETVTAIIKKLEDPSNDITAVEVKRLIDLYQASLRKKK